MSHKKKNPIDPVSLSLPLTGVDSHAHLVSSRLWEKRDAVLSRAKEAGIASIGEVFLRHTSYHEQKDYFTDKEHVFFIYGLHPTDLLKIDTNEVANIKNDIILDLNTTKRIKAIGEIGLDYYWKDVPHSMQEEYFRLFLKMAKELQLPVVIHSREAFTDTLRILLDENYRDCPLLWHCFDGDTDMATQIIANGWHISIPGNVTYKANTATRAALHHIPFDKLLMETDCPYLTPEPWRGTTNEPAFTVFTAKCIAEELDIPINEIWTKCGQNAKTFFNL